MTYYSGLVAILITVCKSATLFFPMSFTIKSVGLSFRDWQCHELLDNIVIIFMPARVNCDTLLVVLNKLPICAGFLLTRLRRSDLPQLPQHSDSFFFPSNNTDIWAKNLSLFVMKCALE